MSKVTSKLQVTIPKAVAERHGIRPGSEVVFETNGSIVRMVPAGKARHPVTADVEWRLRLFDAATARQKKRKRMLPKRESTAGDRGWTREELYDRVFRR